MLQGIINMLKIVRTTTPIVQTQLTDRVCMIALTHTLLVSEGIQFNVRSQQNV